MYNIIKGPNGSYIIEIPAPGLSKETLKASRVGDILEVSSTATGKDEYIYNGIPPFVSKKVEVPLEYKIDLISVCNGIIRVLISSQFPTSIEIQ